MICRTLALVLMPKWDVYASMGESTDVLLLEIVTNHGNDEHPPDTQSFTINIPNLNADALKDYPDASGRAEALALAIQTSASMQLLASNPFLSLTSSDNCQIEGGTEYMPHDLIECLRNAQTTYDTKYVSDRLMECLLEFAVVWHTSINGGMLKMIEVEFPVLSHTASLLHDLFQKMRELSSSIAEVVPDVRPLDQCASDVCKYVQLLRAGHVHARDANSLQHRGMLTVSVDWDHEMTLNRTTLRRVILEAGSEMDAAALLAKLQQQQWPTVEQMDRLLHILKSRERQGQGQAKRPRTFGAASTARLPSLVVLALAQCRQ